MPDGKFKLFEHQKTVKVREIRFRSAGHLCRGCNLVLMGGWCLRMAEAVEACKGFCTQSKPSQQSYWQLQWVSQIRPGGCWFTWPKMQLKARPNIQPQCRVFESWLCHTELTSGKNGVGQHWWETCPCFLPRWLGETCCEQGMARKYEQPISHCLKQKNEKRRKNILLAIIYYSSNKSYQTYHLLLAIVTT